MVFQRFNESFNELILFINLNVFLRFKAETPIIKMYGIMTGQFVLCYHIFQYGKHIFGWGAVANVLDFHPSLLC